MILIQGGSGSGKSAAAEKRAKELSGQAWCYLATMQLLDDEGRKKIRRHRRLREGKGFFTVEQPVDISHAAERLPSDTVVLLECMSNLAANEMFRDTDRVGEEETVEKILCDIRRLDQRAKQLVIVTNNVFEDGICYGEETERYKRVLGRINRELAQEAQEVIEVVVGIPVYLKPAQGREAAEG